MKKMLPTILLLMLFCFFMTACDMIPDRLIPDFLKPNGTTTAEGTTAPITTTEVSVKTLPTINGHELSEYTIVTAETTMEDAELLSALLRDAYGVTLPTATEADGLQILLAESDSISYNVCELRSTDNGIAVYGTGVNATYLAAHALVDRIAAIADTNEKELSIGSVLRCTVTKYLPDGTRDLLRERALNHAYDGTLNIAFLGGSLTQSKTAWTDPVTEYFRWNMPDATINTLNAGIGATDSECGAVRFKKDVLDKMTPDILFIDYAVNDGGYNGEKTDAAILKNGVYLESIINQCRELENPPVIILLYFPLGQRGTSENSGYVRWKQGTEIKEELAKNYGIGTIDVWAHFEKLYQKALRRDDTLTYDKFLEQYYAKSDLVHPIDTGFTEFGEAIISAIRSNLPRYLINKVNADIYFEEFREIVELDYTLHGPTDVLSHAEGNFEHYTVEAYPQDDPRYIPAVRIHATQLSKGVLQIDDGSDFTITLETTAKAIKLYGMNSPDGMKVDILSDGELIGSINTKETNTYLYTQGVMIPDDGKESHTITLRPSEDNEGTVFRFGYIALGE